MKKKQIYMVELGAGRPDAKLNDNKSFIENFQTAILFPLLDKGTLTKWQFDLCVDKLRNQAKSQTVTRKSPDARQTDGYNQAVTKQ